MGKTTQQLTARAKDKHERWLTIKDQANYTAIAHLRYTH